MIIKVIKDKRVKFFNVALGVFLSFSTLNAFARTEYVVLQRRAVIWIFEKYIDYLSTVKDPIAVAKSLTTSDLKWKELEKDNANTISQIKFVDGDGVVVENDRFKFAIHFKYKYEPGLVVWTCRVEDGSIFFHSNACNGWEKRMTFQPLDKH